jgi:hypothetical protein
MRRVFSGLVRGLAVAAIAVALSAPAEAKGTGESSAVRPKPKAVKTVRGWIQVVFDLISDPKP